MVSECSCHVTHVSRLFCAEHAVCMLIHKNKKFWSVFHQISIYLSILIYNYLSIYQRVGTLETQALHFIIIQEHRSGVNLPYIFLNQNLNFNNQVTNSYNLEIYIFLFMNISPGLGSRINRSVDILSFLLIHKHSELSFTR